MMKPGWRTKAGDRSLDRRRLWRALAALPLPALVAVWALWRDVYMLEAGGLRHLGGAQANREWALLSLATGALVASFWVPVRGLRVLAYTLYALVVSVGFGVAGVLGVAYAFGGIEGNLAAPAWALGALAGSAVLCVTALLATAALVVDDVRAGETDEG